MRAVGVIDSHPMAHQLREGLAGGVLGALVGALCWTGWPASFPLPMTIVYTRPAHKLFTPMIVL